jgi:hypothetical protein
MANIALTSWIGIPRVVKKTSWFMTEAGNKVEAGPITPDEKAYPSMAHPEIV